MDVSAEIARECDELKELLLAKNARYGNSALQPDTTFCRSDALTQIAVRCGDKLSRIRNMGGLVDVLTDASPDGEDTVKDLMGYLVLARIAARARLRQGDDA